ncbi:MAG: hypothetical protein PHI40_07255 [Caldisericia bacterium]|nr:hypothetical protein [Caldisericia bacterium]
MKLSQGKMLDRLFRTNERTLTGFGIEARISENLMLCRWDDAHKWNLADRDGTEIFPVNKVYVRNKILCIRGLITDEKHKEGIMMEIHVVLRDDDEEDGDEASV